MSLEKFGLILYFNFLQKIFMKLKYKIQLILKLCFSLQKYFFQKKLQRLDQVHLKKIPMSGSANTCIFFAFLKKLQQLDQVIF